MADDDMTAVGGGRSLQTNSPTFSIGGRRTSRVLSFADSAEPVTSSNVVCSCCVAALANY